jgi:hypothetical protein
MAGCLLDSAGIVAHLGNVVNRRLRLAEALLAPTTRIAARLTLPQFRGLAAN